MQLTQIRTNKFVLMAADNYNSVTKKIITAIVIYNGSYNVTIIISEKYHIPIVSVLTESSAKIETFAKRIIQWAL